MDPSKALVKHNGAKWWCCYLFYWCLFKLGKTLSLLTGESRHFLIWCKHIQHTAIIMDQKKKKKKKNSGTIKYWNICDFSNSGALLFHSIVFQSPMKKEFESKKIKHTQNIIMWCDQYIQLYTSTVTSVVKHLCIISELLWVMNFPGHLLMLHWISDSYFSR